MKTDQIVAARVTLGELEFIDYLAQKTQRNRSQIIRLLVQQARLTGLPDIELTRKGKECHHANQGQRRRAWARTHLVGHARTLSRWLAEFPELRPS